MYNNDDRYLQTDIDRNTNASNARNLRATQPKGSAGTARVAVSTECSVWLVCRRGSVAARPRRIFHPDWV